MVSRCPLRRPLQGRVPQDADWAFLQEGLNVFRQCRDGLVAVVHFGLHRFLDDGVQFAGDPSFVHFSGRSVVATDDPFEHAHDFPFERWNLEQQGVEEGTQCVHVGAGVEFFASPAGLFGGHECGRAGHIARLGHQFVVGHIGDVVARDVGVFAQYFAQAPVHNEHFAILAHHDVGGFDVAVEHAATVGERDGVADLPKHHQAFDL